jgi:DNA (cytosine-5)-methyltransferase 1
MKHLDLFSGIGGFALAARWSGIETTGFVEIDSYCQKVLNKNFPNVPIIGDIKDVKEDTFKRPIDILTGGFPCQPFSVAGKQRGKEDERYLWDSMCNVIKEYKPTWIIGENVTGIIDLALTDVLSSLEDIGYQTQVFIIPACAVDAPHRRDRVWIIANPTSVNGDEYAFKPSSEMSKQGIWGLQLRRCDMYEINGEFNLNKREILESSICRRNDGIPYRVDRLKCLGNSIVPQIAYIIMQSIADIENSKQKGFT